MLSCPLLCNECPFFLFDGNFCLGHGRASYEQSSRVLSSAFALPDYTPPGSRSIASTVRFKSGTSCSIMSHAVKPDASFLTLCGQPAAPQPMSLLKHITLRTCTRQPAPAWRHRRQQTILPLSCSAPWRHRQAVWRHRDADPCRQSMRNMLHFVWSVAHALYVA
jgi:hypothetical protein